jgi:hypothetical protein
LCVVGKFSNSKNKTGKGKERSKNCGHVEWYLLLFFRLLGRELQTVDVSGQESVWIIYFAKRKQFMRVFLVFLVPHDGCCCFCVKVLIEFEVMSKHTN